jgi:uncharacterized protein (DUF427 family)
VWDYPRPPAVDPSDEHVVVEAPDGTVLADTRSALRVLETSHPPGYYLPRQDVDLDRLRPNGPPRTVCEFKGAATYWDLHLDDGTVVRDVGWSYDDPTPGFLAIAGHVTVYPERAGRCLVDDEVVRPQEGAFYGGWVTDRVVGPFKGAPGTMFW